jgi:hypothetical protein
MVILLCSTTTQWWASYSLTNLRLKSHSSALLPTHSTWPPLPYEPQERVEEEEEGEYNEDGEYEGEEEEQDMGPTVEELIERGLQEQMRLQVVNEILQKRGRLALDFRNKWRPPVTRDNSMLDGVVTRYRCECSS